MTYNIFGGNGVKVSNFNNTNTNTEFNTIKPYYEVVLAQKPDIICTQEQNYNIKNMKNIKNFKNFGFTETCGKGGERVGVHYKDEIKEPECITEETKIGVPKRHAIIFKYKGVKIANLHLAGGRFDDKEVLGNNFKKILNFKLELVKKVIKEEPDIILGDFNSVLEGRRQNLNSQMKYFSKKFRRTLNKSNLDRIKDWNYGPYNLLEDNGYKYSKPDNTNDVGFTNLRGKTIIDTIWYNPDKVTCVGTKIIETRTNIKDGFKSPSDHYPVITTVEVKNNTS